ncbi:MAG: phage tail tape measure protein, partial [Sideroxydans sp.]|nr:phage tail tape measure protein [Sideroxydans sp.]
MSSNLQLFLRITALGGAAATQTLGKMRRELSDLSHSLNSFSLASKAAFAYTGFNAAGFAKDAFKTNLDFHRDLLEMKQTAGMSAAQMASAKKHIMEASSKMLATPQEMLEGLRAFTAAGEKYDFAIAAVDESARAASAFFSRPVEIANMDVDLKQKSKLRADQLAQAHNMLLGHARSGRYETRAMSMDAPRTLNTMAGAGFVGIEGVNLMGTLTQQLMKLAPSTQPAEVATYMEHFLAHLTQPHYVQGMMKAGIDIKKYMPGGK